MASKVIKIKRAGKAQKLPKKELKQIKIMAIKDMAEAAKKEIAELTGFKTPSLVGAKKEGANWVFSIELVEKQSIPEGMDILGLYEVKTDSSGSLTEYERKSSRRRADVIEGDASTE